MKIKASAEGRAWFLHGELQNRHDSLLILVRSGACFTSVPLNLLFCRSFLLSCLLSFQPASGTQLCGLQKQKQGVMGCVTRVGPHHRACCAALYRVAAETEEIICYMDEGAEDEGVFFLC